MLGSGISDAPAIADRAKIGRLESRSHGVSFQGDDGIGCLADLFCEPMEELARSDGTNVASLLGHVAFLPLHANSRPAAGGLVHQHASPLDRG